MLKSFLATIVYGIELKERTLYTKNGKGEKKD